MKEIEYICACIDNNMHVSLLDSSMLMLQNETVPIHAYTKATCHVP